MWFSVFNFTFKDTDVLFIFFSFLSCKLCIYLDFSVAVSGRSHWLSWLVKWSCLTWVTLVCGFRWTVHGAQLLLQQLCSSCLTGLSQNTPHSFFFLMESLVIFYTLLLNVDPTNYFNDFFTFMPIHRYLFRMVLKWLWIIDLSLVIFIIFCCWSCSCELFVQVVNIEKGTKLK